MSETVRIHIPVLDTKLATELTIRSIVALTDSPYELVVFDGSTDGTTEMLEQFADRGWLRYEPHTETVAEFHDHRVPACPTRVGVFMHSDVEIIGRGWLRRLLAFQRRTGAAMIVPRISGEIANYVEPFGRVVRNIGAVGTWLMAFDTAQVQDVGVSFSFWKEETDDVPEGMRISDVGGMYYRELQRLGRTVAEQPLRLRLDYRHWRNLSWRPERQAAVAPRIEQRLAQLRRLQDDRRWLRRGGRVRERAAVGLELLKERVRE